MLETQSRADLTQGESPGALQDALYSQDVIDTLRHPFLVLDGNLRVASANRAFYRSFRVSAEATEGHLIYDLGNGQWNIARLRELLEEILPHNESFDDFAVEHDFPHIGLRHMLLNARRVHRGDRGDDLILLVIEDVTDRKRLEEQRQELETRFTSLVKNIADHAIFMLDTEGRIASWNVEAERILGYTEDDAVGRPFSIIFTEEDLESGWPEEELRQARETGRAEDERWHRRKDGTCFWALGIVTSMHDVHGRHTGYSKILRDISERKRMEETLRETDRRKDEFLAMLSHELRNPLSPILSAVQLLQQSGGHERAAQGVIERQVRHLSRLVDDLLDISRISSGRIRLQKSRVEAGEIVEQAVERLRPDVSRKQQELTVSGPERRLWLEADAVRLEQVFTNLIRNASKYTDAGGHIRVTVHEDADQIEVRVADDGMGIAPDLLPQIFHLFTQADRSLDRSEGGLGIGLALVKNLVEQHGGTVEARSEGVGRGSEFTVRLPAAAAPESEPPSATAAEASAPSLRVLVVDDGVDLANMQAMLLRSWGHDVRVAHNGPDAIRRAAGFLPHVILLDIGLPDMDGYSVARQIRQEEGLEGVTLVAITGYGQESDRQRSQQAGFDAHLVKPVDSSQLQELLAGIK